MFLFLILQSAISAQTNLFMFNEYIFTTKTLQTTFAKAVFVFVFCFVKHKSVKIFGVHIMWLVFINYKQQVHWIFEILIRNVHWKSQLIFIAKYIDTNVIFRVNFTKIFFWYRKCNFSVIKIINKLFIFLRNSFWMYFYWINMPNLTPKETFLMVIFDVD